MTEKTIKREGNGDGFSAYYYRFESTESEMVDNILKAVAGAGVSYHHTDFWTEETDCNVPPIESIQTIANESAAKISALESENARLKEQLKQAEEKGAREMVSIAWDYAMSNPVMWEDLGHEKQCGHRDNCIALWRALRGEK